MYSYLVIIFEMLSTSPLYFYPPIRRSGAELNSLSRPITRPDAEVNISLMHYSFMYSSENTVFLSLKVLTIICPYMLRFEETDLSQQSTEARTSFRLRPYFRYLQIALVLYDATYK